MTYVEYAVEGETDVPVAERLISRVGLEPINLMVGNGKAKVDKLLAERTFYGNVLVLRDLDRDAECAPTLIKKLLPYPTPSGLCLRIPVRSVECWLLADVEGFSKEFSVHLKSQEIKPDKSDDPKRDLINHCRRSKSPEVRNDMINVSARSGLTGPGYVTRIIDFARTGWDPERAAGRSPSLARALDAIDRLTAAGYWG